MVYEKRKKWGVGNRITKMLQLSQHTGNIRGTKGRKIFSASSSDEEEHEDTDRRRKMRSRSRGEKNGKNPSSRKAGMILTGMDSATFSDGSFESFDSIELRGGIELEQWNQKPDPLETALNWVVP